MSTLSISTLSMSTLSMLVLSMSTLVYVNPCQVLRESRIRKGTKSSLLSTHQNQPTHSYQYLILQKKKVPFLWMQFVNSEFTFILVPCQLLPSKSQVAFCHFSRWESEHQISDIHQENPKIHPQIWRRCPPTLSPHVPTISLSHFSHFPVFQIRDLWGSFPYLMSASFLLIRLIDGHELK